MNTLNWGLSLALATAYCTFTYNPAYQLLLLAVLSAYTLSKRQSLRTYIKTGLLVSAVPLFVNVFLIHQGKTVLFTIPKTVVVAGFNVPLLIFGGKITAESAAMGAIMAVFITNMMAAFQAFNNSTTPDAVLRLMPQSMPAAGMVSSIALRFIPTVIRDYSSIRDAQASRGVKVNTGNTHSRMGNQLKLIAPTVLTSLERGFNLAESIASRGYTGKRTAYRKEEWMKTDKICSGAFAAAIAITCCLKYAGLMEYWPYDSLVIPPISYAALIPLIALSIPVLTEYESS